MIAQRFMVRLPMFAMLLYGFVNLHRSLQAQPLSKPHETMNFFVVLCNDPTKHEGMDSIKNNEVSITQLVRQCRTLIKSAVALTSSVVRFYVLQDDETLYDRLVEGLADWPKEQMKKLIIEKAIVSYPPNSDAIKNLYKMCTTERIFVPTVFPNLDAGVYLDTDMIFLRPPEDLWAIFEKFNDQQLVAFAPKQHSMIYKVNEQPQTPFPGLSGINGGVFMMNLTRIRNFTGEGWVGEHIKAYREYIDMLPGGDQDILNTVFAKYPHYLFELSCSWNFRHSNCYKKKNLCFDAQQHGARLLHGIGGAYFRINDGKGKEQAVYNAWEDYVLGDSLEDLLLRMQQELAMVVPPVSKRFKNDCSNVVNIDGAFLKAMRDYLYNNKTNSFY